VLEHDRDGFFSDTKGGDDRVNQILLGGGIVFGRGVVRISARQRFGSFLDLRFWCVLDLRYRTNRLVKTRTVIPRRAVEEKKIATYLALLC
jgi:hypothetical protein